MHEDAPLFVEAVRFTAAETGFAPRLIEKDYFCTVLLRELSTEEAGLVFRGGTCLAKVHADFYRLSEDLDFVIPTALETKRAKKRALAAATKSALSKVVKRVRALQGESPLRGANECSQYNAVIGYLSLVSGRAEAIKVEIGLREPLLTEKVNGNASTLLLDPVSGSAAVAPFSLPCLSMLEAMAEKLRAALSRREVAIRDFYDIDYAMRHLGFQMEDRGFVKLVRRKLAMPGNDPADVSGVRRTVLAGQVEPRLRPVLRDRDFADFDLDRAFAAVARLAEALK